MRTSPWVHAWTLAAILSPFALAVAGCAALRPAGGDRAIGEVVRIDSGAIRGAVSGDVLSFKGIPYAAPPVGPLRWRAPQPVTPWSGVRPATSHGVDCVQLPIPGDAAASGSAFGEDCLFVNVWRPAGATSGGALPVLVWIHGGGFLNGGTSAPLTDGSALARRGLVVVTFNYRLGRLGFFAHPALVASGEEAPGNYAFLDQLAGLRWVNRNIAAFGGDPAQATIMGESAGGVSVVHHLAWPAARGLFGRAIVMSGGGRIYGIGPASVARAEEAGLAFARSMGITGTGREALAALRALPVEKVNGDLSMMALLTKPDTYAGGPISDGRIVSVVPGEALRRRTAAPVPVMIGTTTDDLPVVFPPRNDPFSFFGADAATARSAYLAGAPTPAAALKSIAVDLTMHEPARFVAKEVTAAGRPAWLYRFGYVAESVGPRPAGAEHASEVPFLFGTVDLRYGAATTPRDRALSDLFMGYVAAFARAGDPNDRGLPPWPRYHLGKPELMLFSPDGTAVLQADPWTARLDVMERAVEARAGKVGN